MSRPARLETWVIRPQGAINGLHSSQPIDHLSLKAVAAWGLRKWCAVWLLACAVGSRKCVPCACAAYWGKFPGEGVRLAHH